MTNKKAVAISVRDLVEFALQSGDIASGFFSSGRAVEGTRIHQMVQKSMDEGYMAEVPVSYIYHGSIVDLEINGRIDGIISDGGTTIIHEIKTTEGSLDNIESRYNPLHLAQAKCYACIYCLQNDIDRVGVQLTYFNVSSNETRHILKYYGLDELKLFLNDVAGKYLKWVEDIERWAAVRNSSVKGLEFPYHSYRKGQRNLAVAVYRTIRDGKSLFAQAPTGIGKTIAVLFPALKAMAEGFTSKIFYLTPKTTTITVVEKAFEAMRDQGVCIKTLYLTAKDKICLNPGGICDGEDCIYVKGYYDRIRDGVDDIFKETDSFDRTTILEYAKKHCLCPFEFSLELSLVSDCIICDYNYVFDPMVYLKRFFINSGDYCFLIDEAHNFVDRARDMYSCGIGKQTILKLKKLAKIQAPQVYKSLKEINDYFISLRKLLESKGADHIIMEEQPTELYPMLKSFIKSSEDFFLKTGKGALDGCLLNFYFEAYAFLKISEYYDERYATIVERAGRDIWVRLFCIDPSKVIREALRRGRSSVLFSATLSPMDYFIYTLGGDENSDEVRIPSPFPKGNLCLLLDSKTSTRYKHRENSYSKVAQYISAIAESRPGNYIAFFPSYKYMEDVYNSFIESNKNISHVCQTPGMSEDERKVFIEQFTKGRDDSLMGFAVMGGIFSEGIDLKGDCLSGAIIVGVGLPQICTERDIIMDYFNKTKGAGFEYAYMYPGMNRVLQAAGRVIRSEYDRGIVLLIDERFAYSSYKRLYPPEWRPIEIDSVDSLKSAVKSFWAK